MKNHSNFVRIGKRFGILFLLLALVLGAVSAAGEDSLHSLRTTIMEQTESELSESAAQLIQPIGHSETAGNVEITILEAAYDGRTLFLQYSFRLPDVDMPLGITAAEYYGEDLPEGMDPDAYVYGLADGADELMDNSGVGWWCDEIWIDGVPLSDMPDGSGQYFSGTGVPGEFIETDVWRLDNVGVFLEGKVKISLPIGEKQDLADYARDMHPETRDAEGRMLLPEKGIVTFDFDARDVLSSLRIIRPEGETVLPMVTVNIREAVFSPMMTYITMDLTVPEEVMAAYIAENGVMALDEDGNEMWENGPMNVFGSWIDSLQLVDGSGTLLFPDSVGPVACSDSDAEFLLPCLETLPDALYLAPVSEDNVADLSLAIRIK